MATLNLSTIRFATGKSTIHKSYPAPMMHKAASTKSRKSISQILANAGSWKAGSWIQNISAQQPPP